MEHVNCGIRTEDIKAYADSLKPGDKVYVLSRKPITKSLKEVLSDATKRHREYVAIKKKAPNFAMLENGESFTWTEIYIWNVLGGKAGEKL